MATKSAGFSYIEMLVALVIISALSSYVAPKFFSVSGYQQKVFFNDTLNALRFAQKLAISTDCNVLFVSSGNKFSILRPSAADRSLCASTAASDFTLAVARPGASDAVYIGNGESLSSTLSDSFIVFTSKNTAIGGTQVSVNGHVIQVASSTGFVYAP